MRRLSVAATFVLLIACGGAPGGGPDPGSDAARYCDTNSEFTAEGKPTVEYGGKRYDPDCLDNYSWDAPER